MYFIQCNESQPLLPDNKDHIKRAQTWQNASNILNKWLLIGYTTIVNREIIQVTARVNPLDAFWYISTLVERTLDNDLTLTLEFYRTVYIFIGPCHLAEILLTVKNVLLDT